MIPNDSTQKKGDSAEKNSAAPTPLSNGVKGYYFHTMDIQSPRAHAAQILSTAAAIRPHLGLSLVLLKYGNASFDGEALRARHELLHAPEVVLLDTFGIRAPRLSAFLLFNIPAIRFLLARKREGKADFAYFRANYLVPIALTARLLGIPVFYETHRPPLSFHERWRDHLMSMLASGIVVISDHMRAHYTRYGKPLLVAHDAVSLSRFSRRQAKEEARSLIGRKQEERLCVYAGTVSKLKGLLYLLEAARLLPQVQFLLVGNVVPEFDAMPPNVTCTGRVGQADLPPYLAAADVLVLPHPASEYSQSPMKVFEYMASETPIVASRLPQVTEVLTDRNAVLVAPDSGEALAAGIHEVFRDLSRAATLAKQARQDVEAYTWEVRGEKIARFIRETL